MNIELTKGSIFGNLDVATRAVEHASNSTKGLLDKGDIRLRPQDIDRARKYIKQIEPMLRNMKGVLKEFSTIAPLEKQAIRSFPQLH